ncbi:MAG: hypothetical protein ACQR33_03415 [Candidatus Saccharibacteria bacterium]
MTARTTDTGCRRRLSIDAVTITALTTTAAGNGAIVAQREVAAIDACTTIACIAGSTNRTTVLTLTAAATGDRGSGVIGDGRCYRATADVAATAACAGCSRRRTAIATHAASTTIDGTAVGQRKARAADALAAAATVAAIATGTRRNLATGTARATGARVAVVDRTAGTAQRHGCTTRRTIGGWRGRRGIVAGGTDCSRGLRMRRRNYYRSEH